MTNNTIFDDVFRTMVEKMTYLVVPLINEVFHTSWYEDAAHTIGEDSEKLQGLLKEYEDIRINLEKELSITGRSELYTDLNKLIVRISDYIFKNEENVRKGVDEVMGGKVLQLESERLREEGMAIGEIKGEARGKVIGKAEGETIGMMRGEARLSALINRLILDGRSDEIQRVVTSESRRKELYAEYGL